MNSFANIIKKLRTERGLSQEQLAEELGISKSTVAMWETGERYPGNFLYEQIADYFNVDMDYLYGRTNIRKAYHFDVDGNEYVNVNQVKECGYYFDEETKTIAQEIFNNKDLRILFDASRKAKPKYLKLIIDMVNRLK